MKYETEEQILRRVDAVVAEGGAWTVADMACLITPDGTSELDKGWIALVVEEYLPAVTHPLHPCYNPHSNNIVYFASRVERDARMCIPAAAHFAGHEA